ncbi:hypothetical protein GF357_04200 [Candidatus Dojkabacteria bacterium]|nr:hypothetical protein [Candidatus Dojkabacteria bacterium]
MEKALIFSLYLFLGLIFLGIIVTYLIETFISPLSSTPDDVVDKIIKILSPKKKEIIVDCGAGNSNMLIQIAKSDPSIKAVGFEISPILGLFSKFNIWFHQLILRERFEAKIYVTDLLIQHFGYKELKNPSDSNILTRAKRIATSFFIDIIEVEPVDKVYCNLPQSILYLFEPKAKFLLEKGVDIYLYDTVFPNLKPRKSHKLSNGKTLYQY